MKKTINQVKVEGKIYESTLEAKVSKAGKPYIKGELAIQVSDTNVVSVGFWENATTASGAENKKYKPLLAMMSNMKTVVADGADNATMVSIGSSALKPNEYSMKEVIRTSGRDALQQGGFINYVQAGKLNPQATFKNDVMILSTVREIDAQTQQEKDYLTVNAFIFDYNNAIYPMVFQVYNPRGITYFESLAPNTFTQVWGNIESNTIKTQKVTENAFGEALVEEVERTTKQWVITGVNQIAYGEDQMTIAEWQKCLSDRQMYISNLIQKEKEREANKAQGGNTAINTAPTQGLGGFAGLTAGATDGFNF